MGKVICKLTVCFEDPFWVGVFERIENNSLTVAKITFGAEPEDFEVYRYILHHYYDLRFSPAVIVATKEINKVNPKRMQRDIKKQISQTGIGTKSQQALKLQKEQNKQQRKETSKANKLELNAKKFALKQQQKKEKHRGR